MTKAEWLLTQLNSECCELAHIITKAQQFGLYDVEEGQDKTNLEKLVDEYHDLVGAMFTLIDEGVIPDADAPEKIALKNLKIKTWMNYAKNQGVITSDD